LREELSPLLSVGNPEWKVEESETMDGTVKMTCELSEGHTIKSVLVPGDDGRRTAYVSSQVGCATSHVFSPTGQMEFKRQLTSSEIFEQAARFASRLHRDGLRLSSVVLQGSGEPLANFDDVLKAVHRISDELGISMRHITISTVGLVPEIRRLAEEKLQVQLLISLHAAADEERSKLLQINELYPIQSVMDAAAYYFEVTGRRVGFEWALIAGQNDSEEHAAKLGNLIQENTPGSPVTLILLNPTSGYRGGQAQREASQKFMAELKKYDVEALLRHIEVDG